MSSGPRFDKLLKEYQSQISALTLEKPKLPAAPPKKPPPGKRPRVSSLGSVLDKISAELEALREAPAAEPAPPPQEIPEPELEPAPALAPAPAPEPERPAPILTPAPPEPVRIEAPAQPAPALASPPPEPVPIEPPAPVEKISSPVPIEARTHLLRAALAALAVGILWTLWHGLKRDVWNLDIPGPAGLVLRDDALSICSRVRRELVTVDASSGRVLRADHIPGSVLAGLGRGERSIWSVDNWERKIFQHRLGDYAVIRDYPSPGPKPSAVLPEEPFLWTLDSQSGKIFQHRIGDREAPVLFEASLGLEQPAALQRVNGQLWVLDAGARKLVRFQVVPPEPGQTARSLEPAGAAELGSRLASGSVPAAFLVSGQDLLVLTDHPVQLRRLKLSALVFSK